MRWYVIRADGTNLTRLTKGLRECRSRSPSAKSEPLEATAALAVDPDSLIRNLRPIPAACDSVQREKACHGDSIEYRLK